MIDTAAPFGVLGRLMTFCKERGEIDEGRTAEGASLVQKLVGTWSFEGECIMGPDQPAMKSTGSETVRSLGGLWTVGEGEGECPGLAMVLHVGSPQSK